MRALVLNTGNLEDTVCLAVAVKEYGAENVKTFTTDISYRNPRLISAAKKISDFYKVENILCDLRDVFKNSRSTCLSFSNEKVPSESMCSLAKKSGGAPLSSCTPFYRGTQISVMTTVAMSIGFDLLYFSAYKDKCINNSYPDGSPIFLNAMRDAVESGSSNQVRLEMPFMDTRRKDLIKLGMDLGVPIELTECCLDNRPKSCGKCHACLDRKSDFAELNIPDPTDYEE